MAVLTFSGDSSWVLEFNGTITTNSITVTQFRVKKGSNTTSASTGTGKWSLTINNTKKQSASLSVTVPKGGSWSSWYTFSASWTGLSQNTTYSAKAEDVWSEDHFVNHPTTFKTLQSSYTVTISHWTSGWKNGEGNNGNKTAYNLEYTTFSANAGSSVTFNTSRGVSYPRGFYLSNSCGSSSYNNGTWTYYDMPVTFTQPSSNTSMEYDYLMVNYNIKYELNGGTNNSNNPSSYVAPYGVNLQNPTKTDYTFDGWTLAYDVGNLTLEADSSNNWKWEVVYGNVQPGEDIVVKIANAALTTGSSTYYTMRMYDFTSSADIGNIVNNHCEFGSDQEYHFIAPNSMDGSHEVAIIIYAGVAGSTASKTAVFKGITVSVKNTTKINRGENITFSSVSELNNKLRYKNIFNVLCIANWVQAESYTSQKLLPSAYTQVEYLESTGTQYIDTSYYHKTNLTDYDIDFAVTDITIQYQTVFGARTTYNGTEAYYLGWTTNDPLGHTYSNVGGGYLDPLHWVLVTNRRYNVKIRAASGVLVDDCNFTYNPYKTAITHTETDLLFGMQQAGEPIELAKMKLYRCKISESGVAKRYYIPCYRNSDNKPGLYDLVTNTFVSNAGTDEFTVGPVVKWQKGKIFTKSSNAWIPAKKIYHKDPTFGGAINLSAYTPLTYVASGANEGYTNLNFSDADGVKVVAKVAFDSLAHNYGTLCGGQELADSRNNGANALIMQLGTSPWLTWYCGTGSNKASHFELQYSPFIIEVSSIKGNSYMKIGNAIQYFDDNTARGTQPIYVFALNNGGYPGYYAQGKIYWMKIYDHAGTLVRDLIPCKRISDNIVGLLDIVNNYFYVTQSNGAFIGGSELSDWHEGRNE